MNKKKIREEYKVVKLKKKVGKTHIFGRFNYFFKKNELSSVGQPKKEHTKFGGTIGVYRCDVYMTCHVLLAGDLYMLPLKFAFGVLQLETEIPYIFDIFENCGCMDHRLKLSLSIVKQNSIINLDGKKKVAR